MARTLWDRLPESAWIARCAIQLRQFDPRMDLSEAVDHAQSLLETARSGLAPEELALIRPEEAATIYATGGQVSYTPLSLSLQP